MTRTRPLSVLATASLSLAMAGPIVHAQDEIPWLDDSAREIVERVDAFYRALPTVSCTSEVEVLLGENTVDDRVAMRGIAIRPNRVSIMAIEPNGYFPTNQFISNGKELFEWSIRRQMFMLSPAPANFQDLFNRAANRSAPNMPVEVFLAIMSNQPIKNLIRLDVEPGMLRLAGEVVIEGTRCHELVVNNLGTRICVRAESPNWIMRYENSPVIARPRYLPPGTNVLGPRIQIDFKGWSMSSPENENWSWVIPEGAIQMATMHESAKGGPEEGYRALSLSENRQTGDTADVKQQRGSNVGLRVGPKRGAVNQGSMGPEVGATAPDVELIDIDGKRSTLSKIRSGRPAALVFWLTDNKFSRTGIRTLLNALKPFEKLMAIIPIGSGEDDASVKKMIDVYPEFSGSMVDAGDVLADTFSVGGDCAVVLLDRSGRVTQVYVGQNARLNKLVTVECKRMLEDPSPAADSNIGVGTEGQSTNKKEGDEPGSESESDSTPE
jgi:hypothetical protein